MWFEVGVEKRITVGAFYWGIFMKGYIIAIEKSLS